ncbi:DUF1830 domain-containing protein, partial [Pseudanabaenaceae cyanobacterium LEGE 13415]|nr:DUF1830 domain-containing protein [Pseudanabaenaceae cyanobacterium LEGE 13415]
CYKNETQSIQVARIVNIANWYFERVVFPGERLMFEAPQEAHLEIYMGAVTSLSETIPCERLRVQNSESVASLRAANAP